MTDAVIEQAIEETEGDAPDTQQAQKGKVFTQDELNKLIAKEKAAWKRTNEKVSTDHETIVEGLRKDITSRDELIAKQIDLLVSDLGLDEETMELLNGLDVLAKYEWVVKKIEKAGKQEIPRTPKSSGEAKANPFRRTQTV
jgi:hypothetical protein